MSSPDGRRRPLFLRASRWRRAAQIALAALAIGAGVLLLSKDSDAGLTLGTPYGTTNIAIDGTLTDWSSVLLNAAQTSRDGDGRSYGSNCQYSTDRDCPQGGGIGGDLSTFSWTYDSSFVYLYIERYEGQNTGVDFFFLADVNRDKLLTAATDKVIHVKWKGSSGDVTTLNACGYTPTGASDPIADTNDLVDGFPLDGALGSCSSIQGTQGTNNCLDSAGNAASCGKGSADGTKLEVRVRWDAFSAGITPKQFYWHVISSNNSSIASQVDHIGSASGRLGTFSEYGVSLTPDNTAGVKAGSSVTFNHTLANTGNSSDRYDFVATSTQGSKVELLVGGSVIATDNTGDGVWDGSITSGYDSDFDGKPDIGVASASSQAISIRVTVPAGRTGIDTVRIVATSQGESLSTDAAVDSAVIGDLAMAPATSSINIIAGTAAPFPLTLYNFLGAADKLDILATEPAACGWKLELYSDSAGSPGTLVATDTTGNGSWES